MSKADGRIPTEGRLRARLEGEGLTPTRWSNGPGAVYAVHAHPYAKSLIVVQGAITFTLERVGRTCTLTPGDRLDLPPETPHSAVVGSDGVVCLEAHRDDRISG